MPTAFSSPSSHSSPDLPGSLGSSLTTNLPIAAGTAKTALSVNVNKIALLRNTRRLGVPSVVRAAQLCLQSGAQGITVHPRPDERHIRQADVLEIAAMMQDWPGREFNIEGNPLQNLMQVARSVVALGLPLHQCTFVPDSEDQFTSDHGWRFPADAQRLAPLVASVHDCGARVSLFMDPHPEAMAAAKAVGADRVELYTETYASAGSTAEKQNVLSQFRRAAHAAQAAGLGINAGHDLNRANLSEFLQAVPGVLEVSIGHALIADALEHGYAATVKDYLHCIEQAFLAP